MNVGKPIDERLAVFIVAKNLSSIYPSDHHMVESPWSVDPGLARHSPFLAKQKENVNISRMSPASHNCP